MPAGRVLACGLATVDVVQTVERMPGANEKVVALGTRVEAGGPALNAAVTAALLGMPARLATAVGRSPLAEVVRADCAAHGVELVDIAGDGFEVPVSSVLVTESTGERAVVSRNAVGVSSWAALDTVDAVARGVSAVLVDGHHLPVAVAVAARAAAVLTPTAASSRCTLRFVVARARRRPPRWVRVRRLEGAAPVVALAAGLVSIVVGTSLRFAWSWDVGAIHQIARVLYAGDP